SPNRGMERREAPGACEAPLDHPCDRAVRAPRFEDRVAKPVPGRAHRGFGRFARPAARVLRLPALHRSSPRGSRASSTAAHGMSPRTPLCRRPSPLETGKDQRLIVATYSYIGGLSSAARAIAIADLHVSLGGQSRFLDIDDGQTDVLEQAI